MRHHKDPTKCPKQKTTQARKTAQVEDNSSSESAHIPGNHHNCQKHGGTAPVTWRCTPAHADTCTPAHADTRTPAHSDTSDTLTCEEPD